MTATAHTDLTRERMGHADAAWLRMDSPTNLMVVNSLLWFDEPLVQEKLEEVLVERLLARFRRFRQRVVVDHGIWWEDDPEFDLSRHLHVLELPRPRGRRELQAAVASYLAVPLDRSRPLWDLYLIEDYQGGSALFFRVHHCIADGIALSRVLLSLTDGGEKYAGVATDEGSGSHRLLVDLATGLAGEVAHTAAHPRHVVDLVRTGLKDARAAAKLLVLPPDRTYWRRRTGLVKQVAWSAPVALDRVKRTAHATGTTVNDVVLAAVTGALRTDRERRGAAVHDVRVLVPYNLRPLDQPLPSGLGNRFGLVYLDLPLTRATPSQRLTEMSRRMRSIKRSAEGEVSYGILDATGRTRPFVEKALVMTFAAKGSAVMTNVTGPREPVTLGGTTLRGTIGWAPQSGTIGLSVTIYSYAGEIVIGLAADSLQFADVDALMADVKTEMDLLLDTASP